MKSKTDSPCAGVLGSEDGIFISMCKKFSSTSSLDNTLQNWIMLDGNLKTYMESLLSTAISNRVISSLDASQIRWVTGYRVLM